MKTAVFGGTFNPVHIGHLIIAEEVLAQTDCDRVLFVPANIPPHKEVDDPGPELRLVMLRDSIAGYSPFSVSDCEIRRSGVSYTIDTVRYLVGQGVLEPFPSLIIGDDLIEGFGSWKEHDALMRESRIIIVHRKYMQRLNTSINHLYIDNEIFPVSSTMIRGRIQDGKAWRYLVPEAARKTIEEHRLYGLQGS